MQDILVIDDDIYIGDMLEEALRKEGYGVSRAYSGTEALLLVGQKKPDLILLDLMLPGLSGEELLPKIKGIPVIVVSAKADVADKVGLLMAGASDYVTKPFNIAELIARIAVQLRMAQSKGDTNALTFGDLTLYCDTLTAVIDGEEIRLTRTECAILKLLMQSPNTPVGRTTILDKISIDTPDCTERSLKQHISNMRKKLEAVNGHDYIEAVYGIGFKMR
ncbi:response regulator transcription factor [Ruminococcus albus]|uniref:Stage 0 sporulation protein A homolog n=1 Tax=Ruminococcus albus (strain ATCC 27210 / DSM 20455 / JCM 14654 / NCDO 2250 / 7) TaxID=697329 RepID=E6UIQ4_RUMA7|nr:response regulator transcription factor [Ruminococcus albus]ADU21356.1 two component transcriptional regulator, winged helix family [Ruminococcus albus 7 = DSM 20455]